MGLPLVRGWEFTLGETPGRVQPRSYAWLEEQNWRRCIWALVSQRGTHKALPQGGLHLVLVLDGCGVPARWLDNLRRVNFLRLSYEKAKHQRPQEET